MSIEHDIKFSKHELFCKALTSFQSTAFCSNLTSDCKTRKQNRYRHWFPSSFQKINQNHFKNPPYPFISYQPRQFILPQETPHPGISPRTHRLEKHVNITSTIKTPRQHDAISTSISASTRNYQLFITSDI